MITLVLGGAASGKSEYAERLSETVFAETGSESVLWYIATMAASDAESEERIQKHRDRRVGKQYETRECRNAAELNVFAKEPHGPEEVLLLDDIGNYVANELFPPDAEWTGEPPLLEGDALAEAVERLAGPVRALQNTGMFSVLVTNDIFGEGHTEETPSGVENYLRVLAGLNRAIAAEADTVIEVTAGLPNIIKGGTGA